MMDRPRPHSLSPKLEADIHRVRAMAWQGPAYRATRLRYAGADDLLSGLGSRRWGGRWNPPRSFPTVYESLDPRTALDEFLHQQTLNGLPEYQGLPLVMASFDVILERVLDMTDGTIRRSLGASLTVLRDEPWREMQDRGEEAITQAAGRVARSCGFEGLLVPSFANARGKNLVVFRDVLLPDSRLEPMNAEELPKKGRRR